jgi:hypothetical protein
MLEDMQLRRLAEQPQESQPGAARRLEKYDQTQRLLPMMTFPPQIP